MQIVIDIPEEQIKKSLKESEYVLEDEGIKGLVNIDMLYTNGRLEFVDIERSEDFYSCNFMPLPKGHGRLIDADAVFDKMQSTFDMQDLYLPIHLKELIVDEMPTIIEADKESEKDASKES